MTTFNEPILVLGFVGTKLRTWMRTEAVKRLEALGRELVSAS